MGYGHITDKGISQKGGLGGMSGMTFILGMLSPRTNVKGILAGYVGGMIPIACSLIGMFYIPRHESFYNKTGQVLKRFELCKVLQIPDIGWLMHGNIILVIKL